MKLVRGASCGSTWGGLLPAVVADTSRAGLIWQQGAVQYRCTLCDGVWCRYRRFNPVGGPWPYALQIGASMVLEAGICDDQPLKNHLQAVKALSAAQVG